MIRNVKQRLKPSPFPEKLGNNRGDLEGKTEAEVQTWTKGLELRSVYKVTIFSSDGIQGEEKVLEKKSGPHQKRL